VKPVCLRAILSMTLLAPAACVEMAEGEVDDAPVGAAVSAIHADNALNPNALNPNALNPNALNPNALSPYALGTGQEVKQAIQAPGPEGDLSRQLLRYVVRCALKPSQSVSFTWTDSQGALHAETYPGSLGLAESWSGAPLSSPQHRRWVSACLASLVNWYGTSVMVSLRGAHPLLVDPEDDEVAEYDVLEGAFWGDLFSSTPHVRACYRAANVDYVRQHQRDCAAGHVSTDAATGQTTVEDCGMVEVVGPCDTLCSAPMGDGFFPGCSEQPGSVPPVAEIITTWLQ